MQITNLLNLKFVVLQKDWEDHKDDPEEREQVMKGIDKILFTGDIDPSFKLLQVGALLLHTCIGRNNRDFKLNHVHPHDIELN